MKYQVLKQLKTKSKCIALTDTLKEAKDILQTIGASYNGRSYIGDFPLFVDGHNHYSIQGLHTEYNIVLGLSKEDLATF
jgi:hypothetical protein